MSGRRKAARPDDIRRSLDAVKSAGLVPTALHISPDGSFRWDFTDHGTSDEVDLDREFRRLEAQLDGHG